MTANDSPVRVDADELYRLARHLKGADNEILKGLRRGIRKGGQQVARDMRVAAGVTGSTRIPSAIKVVTAFTARKTGVFIKVDRKAAPHAKVMEGRRGGEPLRHPVHATGPRDEWTWVPQTPRPYFYKTASSNADRIEAIVADEAKAALAELARRA